MSAPSVVSSNPLSLDSPQASLVYSACPSLPEPRVSGFKQNSVCWPLKRLSVSPTISSWQTETWPLFTARCIWVPFRLCCCRLGSQAWGIDTTSLRGNPPATEVSLQHFTCCLWETSHLSHVSSALCTSHIVVK